eukprot:293213_1
MASFVRRCKKLYNKILCHKNAIIKRSFTTFVGGQISARHIKTLICNKNTITKRSFNTTTFGGKSVGHIQNVMYYRNTIIKRSFTTSFGGHTSVGYIQKLIMKHPNEAFISQQHLENTWKECLFLQEPDFNSACKEFDYLLNILTSRNIEPILLPRDDSTTADSIHTHDAAFIYDKGYLPMNFAKKCRQTEVTAMCTKLDELKIPHCNENINGSIAHVEAGDFIWLNKDTVCVGNGYRTDSIGICELKRIFGDFINIINVELPHFEGPDYCLHLLSACSPLTDNMWLIYKRAIPVTFLRLLQDYGIDIIEVPDEEWHNWGSNVLATAPGELIATKGNYKTLKILQSKGLDVTVFSADNICALTGGGPTCITRPILRSIN